MRQSEGNKTANRLSAAALIAIRADLRVKSARCGVTRAGLRSSILKTTLLKKIR
jgi:hypothetical protein